MEILVPTCVLIEHRGTVRVRLRDPDVCKGCPKPEAYRYSERHQPLDYTICEQCTRTSYFSDCCDSAYHERWRPYRARVAKSKYVNVCAAVCLLLLVSGFSHQSAAAPHRFARDSKKMDRERRNSDSSRDFFWENPCDLNGSDARSAQVYSREQAKQAALHANRAFDAATVYKDEFTNNTHSIQLYTDALKYWETYQWLRELSWYREEVLPPEKSFGKAVSDEYLSSFVKKDNPKLDEALPVMYKALKLVVAALDGMDRDGVNDRRADDFSTELKKQITQTKYLVRIVLCHFYEIITARNLPQENLKLNTSDIPNFKEGQFDLMLIVYRDSLDYLEYLAQVFNKMHDEDA